MTFSDHDFFDIFVQAGVIDQNEDKLTVRV